MDLRIVIEVQEAIHAAARSHHRAAAFHRKQAAELMARLESLNKDLAEYGITIHDIAPEA